MTETTIERLNMLGVGEVTDCLSYSLNDGERIKSSLTLFENNGWKLLRIAFGTVTMVNVFSPSDKLIHELKMLGAENIIETLKFSLDQRGDVEKVYGILKDEKFENIEMNRQLMNTVWGQIPFDIWYFTAIRNICGIRGGNSING